MPTRTTYKAGVDVVSPDPTGTGGDLIQDNFKIIADRINLYPASGVNNGNILVYSSGTSSFFASPGINVANGIAGLDANGNIVGTLIMRTNTTASLSGLVLQYGELARETDGLKRIL